MKKYKFAFDPWGLLLFLLIMLLVTRIIIIKPPYTPVSRIRRSYISDMV